jgi:signal transduction histidine kinase
MLASIAQRSNITMHLEILDDVPVLVQEDDLYQITFNLVENGIKYNQAGGELFISLKRQDDMAVLSVRDTGVGIPEDAIGHVFERFYRVDKARSRQSGGSGLGLAIVKSMVERNGGEISVQSTVGEGSMFTVQFPSFDTEEVVEE